MKTALKWVALAVAAVFAGCGGGGDDTPAAPAPSIAGFWDDADSSTLITSTGELWTIEAAGSDLLLSRGNVTTNGNAFSGSTTAFVSPTNITATLGGTFVERQSITGSGTVGGQTSAFALTYDPTYDTPASLATAAGTWTVQTTGGGSVTVSGTGALVVTQTGCTFTGQLTPDTAGKNFFRVAGTFGAAPCNLPGAAASGIAVNSPSTLAVAVVSGTSGGALAATKN